MASITSEERKMLDGSEPSDLDYLIMDLGDSDLDLDFEPEPPRPSSPVLRTTFSKRGKQEQSVSISASQPPKLPSCRKQDENNNLTKVIENENVPVSKLNEKELPLSQPIGKIQSPCLKRKRSIQLRPQAKHISPIRALPPAKENFAANSAAIQTVVCTPNGNPEQIVKKNKLQQQIKRKNTVQNSNMVNGNKSDDSDALSLYPNDEDCMSLYNTNVMKEREVTIDDARMSIVAEESKLRNVIVQTKSPDSNLKKSDENKDLRYKIPKKSPDDVQGTLMTKISNLLDENTRSQTLLAAAKFCKSYMGNQIKKVNREFYTITRKLSEKLLQYREMRHLYRIVRLAIDMQIVLSDPVLCGLIDHLGENFENGKIAVIMKVIREKSVMCGNIVQVVANKYLQRRRPKNHIPNARMFGKNEIDSNFPLNAFNRTIAKENHNLLNGGVSGEQLATVTKIIQKPIPSPENTTMSKVVSPKDRRSVIRASTFSGPKMSWKKDPVFVQISNSGKIPTDTSRSNGFGCNLTVLQNKKALINTYHDPDILVRRNAISIQMSVNGLLNTSENEIDANKLGKCVENIAEAVGNAAVPNSVFCAFADLLVGIYERQDDQSNEVDVCPNVVPFLKSALENSDDVNKNKVNLWISRIGIEVSQRLTPRKAYQMAKLMKSMGLTLVPPSLDKHNNQIERKMRFQIVDRILSFCLSEKDLELSLEVMEEYFVDQNVADAGPVFAPLICNMLCRVAELAAALGNFLKAAKCLSMLPAGFGDGSEVHLMEQVLVGVLTDSNQHTQEEVNICNNMVDQMLARGMATVIRAVIVKTFCANVVPLFKYLEAKGVYRRPRIAECPHLIIIPYILCMEEMALVVQRHLTELSEFLMEMSENIRVDIPLRILLSKNIGCLQPLQSIDDTNKANSYEQGLQRLHGAIDSILNPSLKILSKELHPQKKEFLLKIEISSVCVWMLANTEYDENKKLSLH